MQPMLGWATALAVEAARRRQEEEERVRAEVERRNAEAEAREAEIRRNVSLAHLAALAAAAAAAAATIKTAWDQQMKSRQGKEPGGEEDRVVPERPLADRLRATAERRDGSAPAFSASTLGAEGEWPSESRFAQTCHAQQAAPTAPLEACVSDEGPGEMSVFSDSIVLKGGVGTVPTYAQRAEESYRGHSYGGPRDPLVSLPSLVTQALVWLRDVTPFLRWMMDSGVMRPDAHAKVFFTPTDFPPVIAPDLSPLEALGLPHNPFAPAPGTLLDPGGRGLTITGVGVINTSPEILHIRDVWIDLYALHADTQYDKQLAFPFEGPRLTSQDFNRIQPGDRFRLNIDPVPIPPGHRAVVEIAVGSETGRWGVLSVEVAP